MRSPRVTLVLALVGVGLASCKPHKTKYVYVPQDVEAVLGVQAPDVRTAIRIRIDSGSAPSWVSPSRWKLVQTLYATYDGAPLWLEADGVRERASALLAALDSAPSHALRTDAYPLDSIR